MSAAVAIARLVAPAAFLVCLLCSGPLQARPFPRVHPEYAQEPTALPLVRLPGDPHRFYVRVVDAALGERLFFLDTAFSRTTCDDDFVEELGLELERTSARSHGELGSVKLDKAVLPDLRLGGHLVPGLACAVRDLDSTSSVASSLEHPVAGVLGANLLSRFVVVIDPVAGSLTLLDPEVHGLEDGPGVVRLRLDNRIGPRVRLPLDIGAERSWPILDTGATRTHLDARRLDLPLAYEREGVTRASGDDNEARVTFRVHELESALLGGLELGPVRVIDRPKAGCVPGLAGQDLLGGLVLTIDTRHRRLHVAQQAAGQSMGFRNRLTTPAEE